MEVDKMNKSFQGKIVLEFPTTTDGFYRQLDVVANEIVSMKKAESIVERLNNFLDENINQAQIQYKFQEDLQEYYVQIIDQNTKEVIKEIPSRELLDYYANMLKKIGLIIDKRI